MNTLGTLPHLPKDLHDPMYRPGSTPDMMVTAAAEDVYGKHRPQCDPFLHTSPKSPRIRLSSPQPTGPRNTQLVDSNSDYYGLDRAGLSWQQH
jgi:hypothetical protein